MVMLFIVDNKQIDGVFDNTQIVTRCYVDYDIIQKLLSYCLNLMVGIR